MRIARGLGLAAVIAAAAAACSHAVDGSFPEGDDEGGAPHYDGGPGDATKASSGGDAATGDATSAAETGATTSSGGEASTADEGGGAAGDDAASEGGSGWAEAGPDAAGEASGDAGGEAETGASEAGTDSGGAVTAEAGADAADDAPGEASSGEDAGSEAGLDASHDAPGIVAPICDGTVNPGEYGGAGNQATTSSGQTWFMTWDATNLYIAIENADIDEGNILYVAAVPGQQGAPAGGATSGELYDNTDVTTLPFAAQLAVYAHDGYTEARTASAGAWGNPNTTAVTLCDNGSTQTREEVIPWSLLGGLPAGFGWTGYLAADGNSNPQGYIYGQEPQDDPSGAPANDADFTKYFAISNSTTGVSAPFATEN